MADARENQSFMEAHYERCKRYIQAVQSGTASHAELLEITKEQRIHEGLFMKAMMGRKNITYAELCARRNAQKKTAVTGRKGRKAPRQIPSKPV